MRVASVTRWFLAGFAAVVASVVLGGFALFSGASVGCAELATAGGGALSCRFDVAAPPEAVWEAFTATGVSRPYYFDAVLEAELAPGGRWRFVTDDRERLLAGGTVLAVEPPHRFAHTLVAADLDDPPSRITVTLEPLPATGSPGTRVELVHDGFSSSTATYRRFRRAHPLALSALRAFVERGELPLRARLYTVLFEPGMKLFTVRAEPWPEGTPSPGDPP